MSIYVDNRVEGGSCCMTTTSVFLCEATNYQSPPLEPMRFKSFVLGGVFTSVRPCYNCIV